MKIALIREDKIPVDRRVPLTPAQAKQVKAKFGVEVVAQTSPVRCFEDATYEAEGIPVVSDVSDCDILLGVKEVPKENLIPHKTYFYFSHTIKEQPYNRDLLRRMLALNIRMVDYEVLTDEKGARVIAFGRYAGIVGAYNGILTYGKRYNAFDLKPAHECYDMEEMWGEFKKVKLPNVKIVLTGTGRVGNGAAEVLDGMGIRRVSAEELLTQDFDEAVYAQVRTREYNRTADGSPFEIKAFYKDPSTFEGDFLKYTKVADILIAGAYWNPAAPVLFTRQDAQAADFKTRVIADVTCDIEGSIPSTLRPSTIDDPVYDYDPKTGTEAPALSSEENITVMAVDNLPCELPRDASRDFGEMLIQEVLPHLLGDDAEKRIAKATICEGGELTPYFSYLENYVAGS